MLTALVVVGLALLVTSSTLLAAAGRPSSIVSFLLGSYLAAWTTLVVATAVLSATGLVGRAGLMVALLALLAVAVVAWNATGRPPPPWPRTALADTRDALRDPIFVVLGATALGCAAYAVIVGLVTPQNEWDSLSYHLSRAAFWLQQGSVAYVPDAVDIRINGNPPVAEIGQLATLALSGGDRFSWLPQFAAATVLCFAAFGIARRAGFEKREALFGALLLACLPLVILQESTALNDLVVASFLAVATYFAVGRGARSGTAAALAVGLGVGTKAVALLLLPVYVVVVLVAGRRKPSEQILIVVTGAAIGSSWYVLNLVETGIWDGGIGSEADQIPDRSPWSIVTRVVQLGTDALGLPGATPRDVLIYPLVCAVFVVVAVVVSLRSGRPLGISVLVAASLAALAPFVVWFLYRGTGWTWRHAWVASGRAADANPFVQGRWPKTLSDSTGTWFGPVGALLAVGGLALALTSPRRVGRDRALWVSCAVAPFLLILVVATAVPYDLWRGRFFVYGITLASVVWGLAYRIRPLAWAAALASVATALLVLVHSYTKPPGIRLLDPAVSSSVFGQPRWRAQTWIRRGDGTDETVRFVEEQVPSEATIGLALGVDAFVSPYFGQDLGRTVRLLRRRSPVPADASWVVVGPGGSVAFCTASWETMLSTESGFRVFHRVRPDACADSASGSARQ